MSLYFPPVFRLIKKRSIVQTSPSFSFSFSFLSPPVSSLVLLTFSLQKYIYIYTLCLPEFHNHHLFRFLRFHSRSQRGWGNGSYPIVKKRMDNCLQLITKFPRDVKTRACVTPRKNFADGDGIMENTGSEIREREVDRSEVKEKKKLWKDCSNKKEWCTWFLFSPRSSRWKNF